VLARRRRDAPVAAAVAPRSPDLGVMLPATPLQHLLVDRPLVMTSGNVSDEPIAYTDADALERLAPIADRFLVADRPIHSRVDDSVARVLHGRPRLLRRARGYVPVPLTLAHDAPPLLAVGADLKAAFCVARGRRAWVSHHLGDLQHYAAHEAFAEQVAQFEALFAVRPELVVHDLHPGYRSTAYALERELPVLAVQHHHAHLAACLAEHGLSEAVGAIFDGTGYGTDGTIWGGEILRGGLTGCERLAALHPVRLPGGEAAVREPWRMACAWLLETFGEAGLPPRLRGHVSERDWAAMCSIARSPAVSPITTSMGRLFDAVAALCGIAPRTSYEGQAAIELAAAAADGRHGAYAFAGLDPRPAIRSIVADLERGTAVEIVAARFHDAVADATIQACAGHDTVVLAGGVFQNRRLAETVARGLRARVVLPERLPCNDGAIAFGQAAIAAATYG
jgi:hydrogenase maturation protein HypF